MPRKARLITYDGRVDTLAGWAAKLGISREALDQRLLHGWSEAEAVTTKRRARPSKKLRRAQTQQQVRKVSPSTPVNLQLEELKRMDLVLQREVTRTLRQFCRDLDAIMSRGVVRDFWKSPFDRSTPVARVLPQIENS
jgi:hypothetical protein